MTSMGGSVAETPRRGTTIVEATLDGEILVAATSEDITSHCRNLTLPLYLMTDGCYVHCSL